MRKSLFVFSLLLPAALMAQDFTTGLVVSDNVRVRADSNTDAEVLLRADTGTRFDILGRSDNSETLVDGLPKSYWYQITTKSGTGWIWGGFFWPLDSYRMSSTDLSIQFPVRKTTHTAGLELWSDFPDQGNDMPEYDDHSLVAFVEDDGSLWLLSVDPGIDASSAHVALSEGFLTLTSGTGGDQTLTDVSLVDDTHVSFTIKEDTNGGFEYQTDCLAQIIPQKDRLYGQFRVVSMKVKQTN